MKTVITEISSIYRYKTERIAFRASEPRRQVHILSYQEIGWYDHTFDFGILPVRKDMIFFINREDDYSVKCREYGESICVTFKGDTDIPTLTVDCSDNPEIKNLFRKLLKIGSFKTEYNSLTATAVIYEILAYMQKKNTKEYISPGTRKKIGKIHDFLSENYKTYKLDTAQLSEECGISQKYFRTQFKKMYNITPAQYVIELKLSEAAELLSQGVLNVSEIADTVGFSDVYYFSKMFKKHFNVSPKNYSENIK